MKIPVTFLVFALFLTICHAQESPPASDHTWPTTEWAVDCAVIYEESGADYFSVSDDSACEYLHAETGDTFTFSETEKWRVIQELEFHSERMASMGFRPPALDRPDIWSVIMYPGDCLCPGDDCCATESDGDWHASAEMNNLYARSVGEQQNEDQAYDMAHQLFHAVKGSYIPFEERNDASMCAPFCWIGEGMATMIAHTGVFDEDPTSNRKFDESLYTDDMDKAHETGLFWLTTAASFSPHLLSKILEQDFSGNTGNTGHGIYQIHQALVTEGVPEGFLNAYGTFARTLREERYYSNVPRIEPNQADSTFVMAFEDLEPISVKAAKIKIDPRHFHQEIGENAQAVLKIELEGYGESLHLIVDGDGAYPDNLASKDITEALRAGEPIEVWVQVFNLDPNEPHNTLEAHLGELKVEIEVIECTLIPLDVQNMTYVNNNKRGKPQLRMTYDLATESEGEGAHSGKFNMQIVIVKQPDLEIKSSADFTCTAEGVILTGTEAAALPNIGSAEVASEIIVVANTNVIPHAPVAGMVLDDAEIVLESSHHSQLTGAFGINIHYRLTNRRVIGRETVTVPAGTYQAYRIEYDTEASFEFTGKAGLLSIMRRQLERSARGHNVQWLVEGVGWVKHTIDSRAGTNTYELEKVVR